MTYQVFWVPVAEDQLADIWVNAADRSAVTRAGDRIDRLLGTSPGAVGESRPAGERILIEPPLTAYYEVIEDDKRMPSASSML